VSRLLAMIVLLLLGISTLMGKRRLKFPSPTNYRYFFLSLFFLLAVASGFVGFLIDAYSIRNYLPASTQSFIATFLNSAFLRPIFEYVILLYYIFYFSVLPLVLFRHEKDIIYFFKAFFFVFNLSLIVGLIDLITVSQYDISITGRYLYEWYYSGPRNVGVRFHGFFGEPRDAFVVLGLGAGLYFLRSITIYKPQKKYYYILLIVCAFLTRSTSGIIGVIIFVAIYLVIGVLRGKTVITTVIIVALTGAASYFAVAFTPRVLMKYGVLLDIPALFSAGADLTAPNLAVNIYPLIWIVDNLKQFNPLPFLFGGGLGVSSHVINTYSGLGEFSNPNANVIRVLCETGVVGFIVYVLAFYYPVRKAMKGFSSRISGRSIFFSVLVLSLSLGQRNPANFIFLGVFFAMMEVLNTRNQANLVAHRRRVSGAKIGSEK